MTQATMTLADFLLARIDEDETQARRGVGWSDRNTRWGRLLAECEAKRRIIELAPDATGLDAQVDSEFRVGWRDTATEPYIGDVILRALALPYADHPDFRDEWRVG